MLLIVIASIGLTGCGNNTPTQPPLTPEREKQVDDDMRKAIEKNKKAR